MMRWGAQSEQFAAEGYAVFESVLAHSLIDLLREECGSCITQENVKLDHLVTDVSGITHRGRRYFVGECQRMRPRLRQVLFSPVLADICRAALGPTAYFFYDQFVVKGPERGMPFAWHQDSAYMVANGGPADHRPYLTCWIPLDDVSVENGTVRILPYSQLPASRDAILAHSRQPGSNDLTGWEGEGGLSVEVRAGSVVVFSSCVMHATGANHTSAPRRVYLAQYTSEVILNPGTRQLRRDAIPFLRDGEQLTHP